MKDEKSCGTVVHRDGKFLLLKYPAGHWGCPKGHVEGDESETETALRELREETGIRNVKMVPGFRHKIIYTYKAGGVNRKKTVIFFLCETEKEKIILSHEHRDYEWLPIDEAIQRATFDDETEMLETAKKHLDSHDSALNDFI